MITKFATLYCRDSMGRVREWRMEQEDSKYRTVAGLMTGEQVTSEWTVAKAKNIGRSNETSCEEQATKEIENKYKKQLKTGYSRSLAEIDNFQYVEPMLAKLYRDYAAKIDFSKECWIAQCKFNGMRCIATKDGLFTRKGEKYMTCQHIEESLKPFFRDHPDAVLDGELFNEEYRQQLNEISKLIRKTVHISQEDLDQCEKLVKYYVYDGYGFSGHDQNSPYHVRKIWINVELAAYDACWPDPTVKDYIQLVKSHQIESVESLNKVYSAYVDAGHEGIMLRNCNSPYENKRSKHLLKVKPEDDSEAVILDIIEGEGNWSGSGKTITLKWGDKVFDASFKGTYEQAVEFLNRKDEWVGKTVTFLYNGLTGLGTPNFARIDINNCVKGDR
jgi:DNA ligase-1